MFKSPNDLTHTHTAASNNLRLQAEEGGDVTGEECILRPTLLYKLHPVPVLTMCARTMWWFKD